MPSVPESVSGAYAPLRDDGMPLAEKKFSGVISRDWRVASFTSFASHEAGAIELPDRDEITAGSNTPGADGCGRAGGEKYLYLSPGGAGRYFFSRDL